MNVPDFRIVISDCHLSAGRVFKGHANPHEDFHYDDDLCDLIQYFSTGKYDHDHQHPGRPIRVDLIINGDFLDFLNVPIHGEFEDQIHEEIALQKWIAIKEGHPKVMKALQSFAAKDGKMIRYLVGNHDAELLFPKIREAITREWDPSGDFPSTKVDVIGTHDRIIYEDGIEVRHGNQLEPGNDLEFEAPFTRNGAGREILNIPWGSIYVLKIINRLKWERPQIDKIRPIKVFVIYGLLFDTIFTIRFLFLSSFYFVKTRLKFTAGKKSRIRKIFEILREQFTNVFQDLERPARKILDEEISTQTIVFGHTHRAMDKIYPDGKQYINTGTWTKMVDLDIKSFGQATKRTFAYISHKDGKTRAELREWVGEHSPFKLFQ